MKIHSVLFIALTFALFSCGGDKGKELTSSAGYKYILHTNSGNPKPAAGEYVYFHAQSRNGDGVVASSREQGQTPYFQAGSERDPNMPASPVEDVLADIGVGDSVTIFIDIDTIPNKPPGFEDVAVLLYDVVLTEIKTAEEHQAGMQEMQLKQQALQQERIAASQEELEAVTASTTTLIEDYVAGKLNSQIQTTDTGLKYIIHEPGTGEKPAVGQTVVVNYYGALTDGKMFDSSLSRGEPIEFPIGTGRVIPGWDQGIPLLNEGGKATLFIPSDLGYGEAGSPPVIPPNSELIFYVELKAIM